MDPTAALKARFSLEGKTALVTGGTKGIGQAVVAELCALGAKVYFCSRSQQDVDAALASFQQQGYAVAGMAADVANKEPREQLVQQVSDAFGGSLHILVNNVGTNIRKPTSEFTDQDYSTVLTTNLESAFKLCQLCRPLLKAAGSSSILFNSSVAGGPLAMFSGTLYAMSKAALNQLTKNLAVEWAPDGIRVNSVAPWYTATPLAMQVLQDKEFEAKVVSATPMGRIAQPSEVASVMAFLTGPGAAFVTGQTLAVDGGYSVKGFYP
ncbi:hypothetical protein OEZ85_011425 [Tetradesmus obliquus]|uniref:Ketoreductase domain-containing protein n=1 Tax=Tetradesmus obliquus TaxID=3088 RepID=A0ABY8TQB1_TETOB|nr:hypothetical protein OEZ85_011425 [Tetradesmus obliquus]